ncbi:MAG: hypothetical protein J7513_11515 [Solirubrobacteraceae bacterium]|nr:hypothetical protein [Solirubrobacteraceae bacterium]
MKRSRTLSLACIGALSLGTTSAYAASYVYRDSPPDPALNEVGDQSGLHTDLVASHGKSNDGQTVCVSAKYSSGAQVDPVSCSSYIAVKYYSGQKRAWARSTIGNFVQAKLRAEYN